MENYEIHYRAYLDRVNAALEKSLWAVSASGIPSLPSRPVQFVGRRQTHPRGTDPECLRYAGWAGQQLPKVLLRLLRCCTAIR